MGIFDLFSRKSRKFEDVISALDNQMGGLSGRGLSISEAMEVTTVLACVDAIATSVAMPDLKVMKRDGDDKSEARDDPAFRVFHRRPNEFQTAMEFRQQMSVHAALRGISVAIPTRDPKGNLLELIPLVPGTFQFEQTSRYRIQCTVSDEFGVVGTFDRKELFVIRSLCWDLVKSVSAVEKACEAIGLAKATETNLSKLQKNGGRPSGILTTENKLAPETISRIKASWDKFSKGSNMHGTPLLDSGLMYKPMGMSAVDQQTLETRRMQVEEVCRAFGVFPQIVMHTDKAATYASAETFFAAHNRLTAGKWQKLWCEQGDEFVLDGAGPLFLEFDNRVLNAASLKDTGDYYYKALGGGNTPAFMTQNEVRAERGLKPLPGGDKLFVPNNNTDAGDPVDDEPENEE